MGEEHTITAFGRCRIRVALALATLAAISSAKRPGRGLCAGLRLALVAVALASGLALAVQLLLGSDIEFVV